MTNIFPHPPRVLVGSDYAKLFAQAVDNELAGFRCERNDEGVLVLSLYAAANATLENKILIQCTVATELERSNENSDEISHVHITDASFYQDVKMESRFITITNKVDDLSIAELQPSIAALFDSHNQRVVSGKITDGDTKIYSISRHI